MRASANIEESSVSKTTSQASSNSEYPLVILIGGSGFLGSEVRRQLKERGVKYIATCTPSTFAKLKDDGEFVPLDLTAADSEVQFAKLIQNAIEDSSTNTNRKLAVISAMGSIGTDQDEEVNAGLARAVRGAHRANTNDNGSEGVIERFVMIGNTKRVRRLASNVPFLKGYASGKEEAESSLRECFGGRGCIIKPSFIYGGDEFSLQPPRLPSALGSLASEVLGLYPVQALADELPDALALPLAPPISVEMVASAAINVAGNVGNLEGYTELEGEAIKMAATVRGWREKMLLKEELEEEGVLYKGGSDSCDIDDVEELIDEELRWKRIDELKEELLHGGPWNEGEDIILMEKLECLRPSSMKPSEDPKLNGRWNFVLSKDDLGTQLVKEFLPNDDDPSEGSKSSNPLVALLGAAYQLNGLYMRISDEQSQVEIVLSSKIIFGKVPIDIVFKTSLLATNYDEETAGTLFLEKFESIEIGGISLPLPDSWQRFRYLEVTFLDDEIIIARGSGGEPHVLVRAKS